MLHRSTDLQELLLMLEEFWASHPDLHNVPVWYASPLSSRSMVVFETFMSSCGPHVQKVSRGVVVFEHGEWSSEKVLLIVQIRM